MGKDTVCVVQTQEPGPAVAEATEDKTPPIRVTDVDTHASAYSSDKRHDTFCEWNLPVSQGHDTTVLGEGDQSNALNAIASGNEPVMIKGEDDLPNVVADPETVGREEKKKGREEKKKRLEKVRGEMQDPKLVDLVDHLLRLDGKEKFRLNEKALDYVSQHGKQCGGGNGGSSSKGSQTESSQSQGGQGGIVMGGSRLVVGLSGSGGSFGGAGGGDDEDPNNYRQYNSVPGHYDDFMGYEEQPEKEGDALRNAAVPVLAGMVNTHHNPFLPQFNSTHEEPLSSSMQGMQRPEDISIEDIPIEVMDMDLDLFERDAAQYLGVSLDDPTSFHGAPAEETAFMQPFQASPGVMQASSSAVMQASPAVMQASQGVMQASSGTLQYPQAPSNAYPTAEESSSDIKDSFDMIHMMKPPTQRTRPLGPTIGITPHANTIPPSQIPGLTPNLTSYPSYPSSLPSPTPSHSSSYMAPTPSPRPPRTPMTPLTPAPSPMPPQTPSTPQPRGFFTPKSYVEGDRRVCELSVPSDISSEKRNTAFQAVFYISKFYSEVTKCSEQDYDLKVANDVRAKMCSMDCSAENQSLKISLSMPKDCQPLSKWLSQNTDLKDHLLIFQQILNTLAIIHTLGFEDDLTLWGSFMVWVASNLRVYLLVDFPLLLQKQQELMVSGERVNPRILDVMAVHKVYQKVVVPCIGRDGSWASPALSGALKSFERCLSDPSSSYRMAEAARMLGEKRVCKVDIEILGTLEVVFFCLEREELQTALKELSKIAPSRISQMWTLQSASGEYMRVGDVATADRQMQLSLMPCMHPSDARLLYILCNNC